MKTAKTVLAGLMVMAAMAFASCGKMSQEEKYLTSGTWVDEVEFEWTFASNGTLKVDATTDLGTGTWKYTESTNTLERIYNFGNYDIPRHDHIASIDNSTMVLESIDFPGETETWHKK